MPAHAKEASPTWARSRARGGGLAGNGQDAAARTADRAEVPRVYEMRKFEWGGGGSGGGGLRSRACGVWEDQAWWRACAAARGAAA